MGCDIELCKFFENGKCNRDRDSWEPCIKITKKKIIKLDGTVEEFIYDDDLENK